MSRAALLGSGIWNSFPVRYSAPEAIFAWLVWFPTLSHIHLFRTRAFRSTLESHSEILPTHALYGVSCVGARLRSVAVLGVPGHPYSWVVGLSQATEVLTLSFSG